MGLARAALATDAAENMALQADEIADVDTGNARPQLRHMPGHFVAQNAWHLHAGTHAWCPFVDLHVGAADAGSLHLDENFTRSR
jgi:hypothetical protein